MQFAGLTYHTNHLLMTLVLYTLTRVETDNVENFASKAIGKRTLRFIDCMEVSICEELIYGNITSILRKYTLHGDATKIVH